MPMEYMEVIFKLRLMWNIGFTGCDDHNIVDIRLKSTKFYVIILTIKLYEYKQYVVTCLPMVKMMAGWNKSKLFQMVVDY